MDKKGVIDFLLENRSKWENESACFVIDSKKLDEVVSSLKNSLRGEIVYSHKTNPDKLVSAAILDKGIGFLFSSVEELENIAKMPGFKKEKCIFQSPSLTVKQLEKIRELGITRFVVDSLEQLELFEDNVSKSSDVIDLLIRINTGVKVDNPELPYGMDSYLGFPIVEVMDVLKRLSPLREQGKIKLGIHNHLISQNIYLDMWRKNTQVMADFVDKVKEEGIELDYVDFGGGYPIEYTHPVIDIKEIGDVIFEAQKRMTLAFPDMKYIFEPGRKTIGESVTLIGSVAHVKKFLDQKVAILGCSLYNCSMDTLIVDLYLPVCKVSEDDKCDKEFYIVRGSTPDSLDVFSRGVELPMLKTGDKLAFLHAGAYSFGSEFISLEKPKHIMI